jgi:hypothetical protein
MVGGFIAALLIALLITAISALIFRRTGPWGTAWTFFLFLFLALWTVSIYIRNVGPVYWGIAWLPLLFSAVVLALLLVTIIPDANRLRDENLTRTETHKVNPAEEIREASRPRSGSLFWFLIVILVVAIVVGMLNPQTAL